MLGGLTMLEQAIILARTGDRDGARSLLRQYVANEPGSERAWGWLAFCAETMSEQRKALERVLEIEPEREAVRRALEKLGDEKPAREKLLPPEHWHASSAGGRSPEAVIDRVPR